MIETTFTSDDGLEAPIHSYEDIQIREDNLEGVLVAELLQVHFESMIAQLPEGSMHALSLEELRLTGIRFWSAWGENELLGCGALKQLNIDEGEIKSMCTINLHRRKGIGTKILQHIIQESRKRSYQRVNLVTGSMASFAPARSLYEDFGFDYCAPFGEYSDDPNSAYMTFVLDRKPSQRV